MFPFYVATACIYTLKFQVTLQCPLQVQVVSVTKLVQLYLCFV